MTLEEAFKKAISGRPLQLVGKQTIMTTRKDPRSHYKNGCEVVGTLADGWDHNGPINGALLIHCFDHFEEVVKALEEEHSAHMDHNDHAEIHGTTVTCPVCKRIQKMKEVKVWSRNKSK